MNKALLAFWILFIVASTIKAYDILQSTMKINASAGGALLHTWIVAFGAWAALTFMEYLIPRYRREIRSIEGFAIASAYGAMLFLPPKTILAITAFNMGMQGIVLYLRTVAEFTEIVLERAPRSARISITATQTFLAINAGTAVSAAAAIIPSAIPFAVHTPGSPAAVAVMRAYIILGAALSIIAATGFPKSLARKFYSLCACIDERSSIDRHAGVGIIGTLVLPSVATILSTIPSANGLWPYAAVAATAIALLWKAYQEISLCRDW